MKTLGCLCRVTLANALPKLGNPFPPHLPHILGHHPYRNLQAPSSLAFRETATCRGQYLALGRSTVLFVRIGLCWGVCEKHEWSCEAGPWVRAGESDHSKGESDADAERGIPAHGAGHRDGARASDNGVRRAGPALHRLLVHVSIRAIFPP